MSEDIYNHSMYFGDFVLREVDGQRIEVEHQPTEKKWHFPIEDVDDDPLNVIRSGEALTEGYLDDHAADESAHHERYTDEEAQEALRSFIQEKADLPHGDDAHTVDYLESGGHGDEEHDVTYLHQDVFTDHSNDPSTHHSRYTDEEARNAVDVDIDAVEDSLQDKADRSGDDLDPSRLVVDTIHRNQSEDDSLILEADNVLSYNTNEIFHEGNLTPVRESVFDDHIASSDAHHSRYTDEEAQDAISGVYAPSGHGNEEHDIDYLEATHVEDTATHGVNEVAGTEDIDAHNTNTGVHGVGDSQIASISDIQTHSEDASAHHEKYTDADAQSALSTTINSLEESIENQVSTAGDSLNGDLTFTPGTSINFEYQDSDGYIQDGVTVSYDDGLTIGNGEYDLIRQPPDGPTQFLQGADIGSIESPEDSYTQLINASTVDASDGDRVGYTFAIDNQTVLSIDGTVSSGSVDSPTVSIGGSDVATTDQNITSFPASGNDGQFLRTDGTSAEWTDIDGMENHGNEYHSENFIAEGDDATILGTSGSEGQVLSVGADGLEWRAVESGEGMATHGNEYHSENFATTDTDESFSNLDISGELSLEGDIIGGSNDSIIQWGDYLRINGLSTYGSWQDDGPVIGSDDRSLNFVFNGEERRLNIYSNPSNPTDPAGSTNLAQIDESSARWNIPILINGETVSTETWVESNYNNYTFSESHSDLTNVNSDDHHSRYTDQEALDATSDVYADSGHSHDEYALDTDVFSGSHNDLTDVGSDDHHTRYTDDEARSALDGSDPQFGQTIGFQNDAEVITYDDSNNSSGPYWDSQDSLTIFGDGNTDGIVFETGNLQTVGGVDIGGSTRIGGELSFNDEFTISTDDGNLVIGDGTVDLLRQPASGPTQFLQGAEIGSIEAPEDSLTQLINASSTSNATSGDQVGYTFSLNSSTAIKVVGEADGSGGVTGITFEFHGDDGQIAEMNSSGDLRISGTIEEGVTF